MSWSYFFRIVCCVLFGFPAIAQEAPTLPRVLIIGDSISLGYTPPLQELLKGRVVVVHNPGNASSTAKGVLQLEEWLGKEHWDLIHFNFGLHDIKFVDAEGKNVKTEAEGHIQVPLPLYRKNLKMIVARLQETGAKLIFATTTPFPEVLAGVPRKLSDLKRYNAAALKIMRDAGVSIDDLGGFVTPHLAEWQHPRDVHFKPEGSRAIAGEVARVILAALPNAPAEPIALEEAGIEPSTAVSAQFGTWAVTYSVGQAGFAQGGALRVELPDAMHGGPRNSGNRLQATDSKAPHFVSAHTSRADVKVETTVEMQGENELIKHMKPSLDGRSERYVFVVRVDVKQGTLQPGDTVSVVYGDTSQGSPGYRAGDVVQEPEPVLIEADPKGDGQWHAVAPAPQLALVAGPVTSLLAHAPSRGVVGEAQNIKIAFLDAVYNPASFDHPVKLNLSSLDAGLAAEVQVPAGSTHAEVPVTPSQEGVVRLQAHVAGEPLLVRANPMEVLAAAPQERIYWGDLHSHTSYSWDGIGKHAFDYARYTSGLDFYARTDHSMAPLKEGTKGLYQGVWDQYIKESESFNAPPAFVTLHAYECSFGSPYGHHNVFFRGTPGPLLYPSAVTLPELWQALKAGEALTIPHHTGKFPRPVDLSIHNEDFRRNFEIYSGHGLSEAYNPEHPLAFEHSDFTDVAVSQKAPSYAQDAWRMGQHMSVVAASDDHRAKPGQPNYGITAVYAPANTREAIFDALHNRRTYGTSGSKIILDFSVDGKPMGSIAAVAAQPVAKIHAVGTDAIAVVELLQWRPGDKGFSVVQRWEPSMLAFDTDYTVKQHVPGAIYYVRVIQEQLVRTRAAEAWSSPVWTTE